MQPALAHAGLAMGYKNAANIALIPEVIRKQVFGKRKFPQRKQLEDLALAHLKNNNLYGKETSAVAVMPDIKYPKLLGQDLDEHFSKIGQQMSQPYLEWCQSFTQFPLKRFSQEIQRKSGWVKYTKAGATPVEYPTDSTIVFDVEVLYKLSDYPVMATAAGIDGWYVWLSPWLLGETTTKEHLIPLGNHQQLVIGHNVSYDRKRVKEEYSLRETKKFFMDTMSLHITTAGMCSRQRPIFNKHRKQSKQADEEEEGQEEDVAKANPWLEAGTLNNIADVYAFNYPTSPLLMDKSQREWFSAEDKTEITDRLQQLVEYCALDVYCTKQIFDKVLPKFLENCPHPISFGALKPMGSLFLPINEKWDQYLKASEDKFNAIRNSTSKTLTDLAEELCEKGHDAAKDDPWYSQLDWTTKPPRFTKAGKLVKNQKHPGKPEWYRALYPAKDKPMNLTLRTRITPLLLKLQWNGQPLIYVSEAGWCFRCPHAESDRYVALNYPQVETNGKYPGYSIFKVPHKDGPKANCGNPMAKGYLSYFESGVLTAENPRASEMLKENAQVSYWTASRGRAFTQMPVFQSKDLDMGYNCNDPSNPGMIIPRFVSMGTVTRRAVENMWLTASNAKSNRVGSELKAMVTAPKGYSFIGADVDSEELWIASVVGDSLFGLHGGTALGWMTLEGSKSNGTDLHSRTAGILEINRDQAKVFNYGRIYGAGETFAATLLKQFNPNVSESQASEAAKRLYKATKGKKVRLKSGQFWRGGSESVAFNQLELMAQQTQQRTPILGAGITSALLSKNLDKGNGYLTSRINWSIQSSGVDYLHLLIASMHYLCKAYNIDARLMITIHDEIRYMVKEEDKYRASLALQISNLWTRAMFCQQLGMDDLPQSVAYFSAVDIDHVLRKEVHMDCVTPSHVDAIEPGTAVDISQLADICNSLGTPDQNFVKEVEKQPYKPRMPIMSQIRSSNAKDHINSLVAQVATTQKAASKLLLELENTDTQWLPAMRSKKSYRL